MKKSLVIVGAGKEGKGTLGDMFTEAGNYQITFLDKNPDVITSLMNNNKYTVEAYYSDRNEKREVSNYQSYLLDQDHACEDVLVEADLVMLALYPEDIPEAVKFLRKALKMRISKNPEKLLSIVSCTNKNHIMPEIYQYFVEGLTELEKNWFDKNVALRDMIVRRSSNAKTTADLFLTTKVLETLLIQKPLNVDISDVKWIQLVDDLEDLKDIKLFTRNGPHATSAYAGYYKGYSTIGEAKNDPEIAQLMDTVLEETKKAVMAEYNNPEEKLDIFLGHLDLPSEEEPELISRVGFDPLRKLYKGDRLTGVAQICEKHSLSYDGVARAIAFGVLYDDPEDESATKMKRLLEKQGDEEGISQILGLPATSPITKKVVNLYQSLKK
ncbi:mannitol dehydrogenase family protein [Enterococcus raffinosus]|uniref:Uncharacterized protein n=1 Tax=Enterococcus raffinosus ATCC 49464 TaxID=1158602 RepID=R2QU20_9ENTE|nr:hypothetical protein [Enterococcus raffinosus]EOH74980.1 hypothetical protein UAK_03844 [Enterococcus raffinosus ATCC 49464]EOT82159.1 hypothetical protein I590_00584 [Enterococcus raffinosus ATCC 49464]OJG84637.1 hypothetical protein RV13_GL001759 [Enterococcus raffinosus]UXK04593.1 mannitol dehydrogenase [Enterococcus raffinosus]